MCCCNHCQRDERTFPLITLGKVQIRRSGTTSGEELTDGQTSWLSKHSAAAESSQQRNELSFSSYLGSAQSGERGPLLPWNLRVKIISSDFEYNICYGHISSRVLVLFIPSVLFLACQYNIPMIQSSQVSHSSGINLDIFTIHGSQTLHPDKQYEIISHNIYEGLINYLGGGRQPTFSVF